MAFASGIIVGVVLTVFLQFAVARLANVIWNTVRNRDT